LRLEVAEKKPDDLMQQHRVAVALRDERVAVVGQWLAGLWHFDAKEVWIAV